MGSINDVSNVGPSASRLGKNEGANKLKSEKGSDHVKKSGHKDTAKDVAQISSAGRELLALKLEAAKYVDEVKRSENFSEFEIEQIKEKIQNKYFLDSEVIDKIVDELVALPNYL